MGANNVLVVERLTERKLIGPLYFIDILYSWPKGERPLIILVKGTLAVMVVLEIKIKPENCSVTEKKPIPSLIVEPSISV